MGDRTHSNLHEFIPAKYGVSVSLELFDAVLFDVAQYSEPRFEAGGNMQQVRAHTPLLIGKLLWVIRKHMKAPATCSHTVVEKGGEKRKKEGMCGSTHTTFLPCFGEQRNKVLTLS